MKLEASDIRIDEQPVLRGGPVHSDRGFVLHRPGGSWDSSHRVSDQVQVTTSKDVLSAIARGEGPEGAFIALGYAGWALVCAGVVYWGCVRLLPSRAAALALGIAWISVVGDVQRAQSNAFVAGLMILAWVAYEGGRQVPAAIAVAMGAFVKLFPLAAGMGALVHRKWLRFCLILTGVIAVGAALPLIATSRDSLGMQYRSWYAIESSWIRRNISLRKSSVMPSSSLAIA